jgi:serine/threonine protein kinase
MGVVYQATDLRLRLPVALKFVSVPSPELLTRLASEARAAAALNHPNICTIYEIDEAYPLLAMEYVEGETIAEKIKSRPLPLNEVLDIAIQAGAALQAAHDRGITHRDIKSSNLMVTAAGQVKVLDFGLALMQDQARVTRSGVVTGTPSYMSPEQATGEAVDHRTDIWSLGVVLYEMLTGYVPFRGDSALAVLGCIVRNTPEPAAKIRHDVPAELDRILNKALAKKPGDRFQHARDVCADLRRLRADGSSSITMLTRRRVPRRALLWAGGGVAAGALTTYWTSRRLRSRPDLKPLHVSIPIPDGAGTADPGRRLGPPVVAPDGSAIVVSLKTQDGEMLFIRRLDANKLIQLPGTLGASYPFWSPDSRHIAFFADGELKRMPAAGGASVVLCDVKENRGGAWGGLGTIIFGMNFRGLFSVAESGGQPVEITHLNKDDGENSHRYPVFLPDGKRFLFFVRNQNLEKRGIYQGSLDQQRPKRRIVVADGQFALGSEANSDEYFLLTQQSGKIVAQPFDLRRNEVSSDARVLLDMAGQVSCSKTGVLVIRPEQQDRSRIITYDRTGRELGALGAPADYWQLALSPDDKYVAVVKHEYLTGQFAVRVASLPGGSLEPVSAPEHLQATTPAWSSDSRSLIYAASPGYNLVRRSLDARDNEEPVTQPGIRYRPTAMSRDGRFLFAERAAGEGGSAVCWMALSDGAWHTLSSPAKYEAQPRLSPDGRWLAFTSNSAGINEVYVARFPDGTDRTRVSSSGGSEPRWRGDGKELFYLGADDQLMALEVATAGEFRASTPRTLFKTRLRRGSEGPLYDAASDGQRFLAITGAEAGDESNIEIVFNWRAQLG